MVAMIVFVVIVALCLMMFKSMFSIGSKKVNKRLGSDAITYDDYVALMFKLEEIHEVIERDKG